MYKCCVCGKEKPISKMQDRQREYVCYECWGVEIANIKPVVDIVSPYITGDNARVVQHDSKTYVIHRPRSFEFGS
jgi:hypothetical protein